MAELLGTGPFEGMVARRTQPGFANSGEDHFWKPRRFFPFCFVFFSSEEFTFFLVVPLGTFLGNT